MLDLWVNHALTLGNEPADLWCGGRKILRARQLTFSAATAQPPLLKLEDAGYTTNKLRSLEKAYFVRDSYETALALWADRAKKGKYGSVSFHCYNHLIKGHAGSSRIASNMGPCIQAVSITLLGRNRVAVDAFYRTTELFKKFPADLVFLHNILQAFNLPDTTSLTCHFANITLHPMYWITLAAHCDPVHELKKLEINDPTFWKWVNKWNYRYLVDDGGIRKYAQAMRVKETSLKALSNTRADRLRRYLEKTMEKDDAVLPELFDSDD